MVKLQSLGGSYIYSKIQNMLEFKNITSFAVGFSCQLTFGNFNALPYSYGVYNQTFNLQMQISFQLGIKSR